ncbi:MAG: Rne/Rng family ribonuclease [Firmicutes bacterium]|nr:Rne/Rng family ribonuclease [Bacillota bacterium]
MSKEIIVNSLGRETRVAVVENGKLVELFLERPLEQRVVGNIYKGIVENVLPGMQAAFVNVGLERNTFLYVSDAIPGADEYPQGVAKKDRRPTIRQLVQSGKEILVQVTKEPFGSKGARVTRRITLPGRYVVLMPSENHIGVSRRIDDEAERERLRQLVAKVKPKRMGVIVRTVAVGCTAADLQQDIDFLVKLWHSICQRSRKAKAPTLIHRDLDLVGRVIRDRLDDSVDRLVLDSSEQYQAVMDLLSATAPEYKERVFLWQQKRPIFDTFGLELELDKALRRKVWLKSGGYLIIDQTEALTAIDVNTGKYVGTTNLADTVLKTNLEAATEIAHQLRLRNIGGIIIIDFIDMTTSDHRQQVLTRLEQALKADKTKTSILGLTQLGLVEMTRQKVRQAVGEVLQKPCPCCDGTGRVLHEEVVSSRIEAELLHYFRNHQDEAVLLDVNPAVAAVLIGTGGKNLERLEAETGRHIYVRGNADRRIEDWAIVLAGNSEMVERVALPVQVGDVLSLRLEDVHQGKSKDAIARKDGFVIQVDKAAQFVGQKVLVEIVRTFRTYAKGRLAGDSIDVLR